MELQRVPAPASPGEPETAGPPAPDLDKAKRLDELLRPARADRRWSTVLVDPTRALRRRLARRSDEGSVTQPPGERDAGGSGPQGRRWGVGSIVGTAAAVAAVVGLAVAVLVAVWSPGVDSDPAGPVSLPYATSAMPGAGNGAPDAELGAGALAAAPTSTVVVNVAGAVNRPGVIGVPVGSRVADALEAAGGARAGADLDRLNLAAPLADGTRVWVPTIGVAGVPSVIDVAPAPGATGPDGPAVPVDINTATAGQLETLPGIGPATASAIVDHRDRNGPFADVDALADVRGIGPAKLDAIRRLITASGSPEPGSGENRPAR